MLEDLSDHVISILHPSNCFIVYNELNKLQLLPPESIRKMTMECTKVIIESDSFADLVEEGTLICLLNMDKIKLDEIVILRQVSKWIDKEVVRRDMHPTKENKRRTFKQFKSLIRFTDLSIGDLANFDQLENLLSDVELNSLMFHLLNRAKPLSIPFETWRRSSLSYASAPLSGDRRFVLNYGEVTLETLFPLFVRSIATLFPEDVPNLTLSLRDGESGSDLKQNISPVIVDGKWCFFIEPPLQLMNSDFQLLLVFQGQNYAGLQSINLASRSEWLTNAAGENVFRANVFRSESYHCLEKVYYNRL